MRARQKPAPQRVFLLYFWFSHSPRQIHFSPIARFHPILNSQAVPGILAIGITLLMISGEFDLSVGSILGVSSLAFLYATVNGVPILLAAGIGLIVGCVLGLINGLLLISTGIPSFIITLGTMLAYRAIPLTAISGGRIIRYADYSRESPILEVPGLLVFILTLALFFLVLWIARDIWRARSQSLKSKILLVAALLFYYLSRH